MNIFLKSTLIFLTLLVTSCYLPSDPNNEFGTGDSGSVAVSITDNSKDSVESLWVTVESININMSYPKISSFNILDEPQSFNIRTLDGIIHQLNQVPLRIGTYSSIDITFGSEGFVEYLDGTSSELTLTEKNFSIPLSDFDVILNRTSNLDLDFDLSKWVVSASTPNNLDIPANSIKKMLASDVRKIHTKTFQFRGNLVAIADSKIKLIKDGVTRLFNLSNKLNVDELKLDILPSGVSKSFVFISGTIDEGVYSADIIHKLDKNQTDLSSKSLIYGVFDGPISNLSSDNYIVKANLSNSFSQSIPKLTKGIKLKISKDLYSDSKSCLFHQANVNFTAKGYFSDGFFIVEHIKTPESKNYVLEKDGDNKCYNMSNNVIVKSFTGSNLLVVSNDTSFNITTTNIKITNGDLSCLVPGALIRHIGPFSNPVSIHIIQGCPSTLKNKEDKSSNLINITGTITSIDSTTPSTHSPVLSGKYNVLAHKLPNGVFLSSDASIYFNTISKKIDNLSDSSSNDFLGGAVSFQDISPGTTKYYTVFNPTSMSNDIVEVKSFNDYIQLVVDSGEEIIIRSSSYTSLKTTKHIASINIDTVAHNRLGNHGSALPGTNVKLHLTNNIRFSSGMPSSLENGDTIVAYGRLADSNNLDVTKILFPERELDFDMTSKSFLPTTIDPQLLEGAVSKNIKSTIHSNLFQHFNDSIPHYTLSSLTPHYNPDGRHNTLNKDNEFFFNFLYSNLIDINDVFTDNKFIIKDFSRVYLASVLTQLKEYFNDDELPVFTKDSYLKSLQSDYTQSLLNIFNQHSATKKLISSLSSGSSDTISSSKLTKILSDSDSKLKNILKDQALKNSLFISKFTNDNLTLEKIDKPLTGLTYSSIKELDLYNDLANSLGCKEFTPPTSSISQNKITINPTVPFIGTSNLVPHLLIPSSNNSTEYNSLLPILVDAVEFKDSDGNLLSTPSWLSFIPPSLSSPTLSTSISKEERADLLGSVALSTDTSNMSELPNNTNYTIKINYNKRQNSSSNTASDSIVFYLNVLNDKHSISSIISDCNDMKEYFDFNISRFDLEKILQSGLLKFEDNLDDTFKNKLLELIDGSKGELLDTRKIRSIVNLLPPTTLHSATSKNYLYANLDAVMNNHLSAGISFATVSDAKASYPLRIDKSKVLNYLNEMYGLNQNAFEYFDKKIGSGSISAYLLHSLGSTMYSLLPIEKGLFGDTNSINWSKLKENYIYLKSLSAQKPIPDKRIQDINSYFQSRYGINLNIQLSEKNKYSIAGIASSLSEKIKNRNFSSVFNNLVITHDINRLYSESFQDYNDGYNNAIYKKISILRKYNPSISISDITDKKYDKRYKTETYVLNYHKYFTIHYDLMKSNKNYLNHYLLSFLIDALEHHPDSNIPKPDNFSLETTNMNFFGFDLNGVGSDNTNYSDYYQNNSLSSISIESIRSNLSTIGLPFMDPLSQSYKPVFVYDNEESQMQYKVYLHKIYSKYKSLFNKGSSNTSKRGGGIGVGGYNGLRYEPKSVFLFKSGYNYFLPLIAEYADDDYISYNYKNKHNIINSVRNSINYYTRLNNTVQCYYDGDGWYGDVCNRLNLKPEYKLDYYKNPIYLKYFPPVDGSVPPSKYSDTSDFTYKAFNFMSRYYPNFHPYMVSSETGYVSRTLPSLLPNFFDSNDYKSAFSNYMLHQLANELTGRSFTTTLDYRTFILEELSKD